MSGNVIRVSGRDLRRFHDEHLAMINQAPTPMQLGLDTVHALGFVEALGVIGFSLVYVQTLVDEINAASEARLAVFKAREAARTH